MDRRGFLGVGLGALAGVSAGAGIALAQRARAVWGQVEGFPDCPVTLGVDGAGPAAGAVVEVRLFIATPREELVRILPGLRADAEGRVRVALRYPYEEHLNGHYRYHAEIWWPEGDARTEETAGYEVRPMGWFA